MSTQPTQPTQPITKHGNDQHTGSKDLSHDDRKIEETREQKQKSAQPVTQPDERLGDEKDMKVSDRPSEVVKS